MSKLLLLLVSVVVATRMSAASTVVECSNDEPILFREDEGGATTITARNECTATKHRSKMLMVDKVERCIMAIWGVVGFDSV